MLRLVSFGGLVAFLALCWLLSADRRRIPWRTVGIGMALQLVLGLLFLSWDAGNRFLQGLSVGVGNFLNLSSNATQFVFGRVLGDQTKLVELYKDFPPGIAQGGFVFAFHVLPTIIFFASFMSVMYHLGVMGAVVKGIAWVMVRTMRTSGSETLSCAANIFVGQTEAPLLVKPFIDRMTRSELMAIMTGGFATIAGGVFALVVGFGVSAGHLIIASVMSAPAALVVAKMLLPETEESATSGTVKIKLEKAASNVVEAAANGATDGLKLALNVAAMLIAFISLIAVVDWLLGFGSQLFGVVKPEDYLTLRQILGWAFAPFAFCLGVEWSNVVPVGELLGTKIAGNEVLAYQSMMSERLQQALSPRSLAISTYALCGFANFSSIAIQIGGISALAPERRGDLARLGFRAMFGGALASWMTAAVAGILI